MQKITHSRLLFFAVALFLHIICSDRAFAQNISAGSSSVNARLASLNGSSLNFSLNKNSFAYKAYVKHSKNNDHYEALKALAGAPVGIPAIDLYYMRLQSLVSLDLLTDAGEMAKRMLKIYPHLYDLNVDLISLYFRAGNFKEALRSAQNLVDQEEKTGNKIPRKVKDRAFDTVSNIVYYNPFYFNFHLALFQNDNINQASEVKTIYVGGLPFTISNSVPMSGFELQYNFYAKVTGKLPKQNRIIFFANPYGTVFLGPALTSFTDRFNTHSLRTGITFKMEEGLIDKSITIDHTRLFESRHSQGVRGSHTMSLNGNIKPYNDSSRSLEIGANFSRGWYDRGGGYYSFGPYLSINKWFSSKFGAGSYLSFGRTLRVDSKFHSSYYRLVPSLRAIFFDVLFDLSYAIRLTRNDLRNNVTKELEWKVDTDLSLRIAPLRATIFKAIPGISKITNSSFNGFLKFVPVVRVGYKQTFSNNILTRKSGLAYARMSIEAPF